MEPSVKRGLKISSNGHGPLIKMAAMPIYGTFLHIGPSVEGMLTICSNVSAQLNKMAAMPIYGKNT